VSWDVQSDWRLISSKTNYCEYQTSSILKLSIYTSSTGIDTLGSHSGKIPQTQHFHWQQHTLLRIPKIWHPQTWHLQCQDTLPKLPNLVFPNLTFTYSAFTLAAKHLAANTKIWHYQIQHSQTWYLHWQHSLAFTLATRHLGKNTKNRACPNLAFILSAKHLAENTKNLAFIKHY